MKIRRIDLWHVATRTVQERGVGKERHLGKVRRKRLKAREAELTQQSDPALDVLKHLS